MQDLHLHSKDLNSYKKKEIYQNIFHIESTLYAYSAIGNKKIILKVFDDYMYKKLMQDKIHKTTYFKAKNFSFLTNPLFNVYISDFFAGYAMYNFNGISIKDYINSKNIDRGITLFKLVSNYLKILHENNIVFGDINKDNILTNGTHVKFCDIDSFGTPYSSPTTLPYTIYQNINIKDINLSPYSDLFIINLLILDIFMNIDINTITNIDIYSYKELIKSLKLSDLLNKVYLNIYDNLLNQKELIYPSTYLDELKDIKKKAKTN